MSNKHKDKGRLPPFIPLLKDTIQSPAWRALSHGARSLYIALKAHYSSNFHNNGKIYISTRDAADELGSDRHSVIRWFRELEHYGFIVKTAAGCLGVDGKGKAPHWRLTELGYMKDAPTRDFMSWNGKPFDPPKKQNPGAEMRTRVVRKSTPVVVRKSTPLPPPGGVEMRTIGSAEGGAEIHTITSFNHLPVQEERMAA
jgi:hypothetical protein